MSSSYFKCQRFKAAWKEKKIYKWIENKNGKESAVFLQEADCTYSDMKI